MKTVRQWLAGSMQTGEQRWQYCGKDNRTCGQDMLQAAHCNSYITVELLWIHLKICSAT